MEGASSTEVLCGMGEPCGLERQVAGGNQVFQVVVDTDDIATQISGLLYREKVRGVPH